MYLDWRSPFWAGHDFECHDDSMYLYDTYCIKCGLDMDIDDDCYDVIWNDEKKKWDDICKDCLKGQ